MEMGGSGTTGERFQEDLFAEFCRKNLCKVLIETRKERAQQGWMGMVFACALRKTAANARL
jgi:hypothetical protein